MHHILFEPAGKACDAEHSRTVIDAARGNAVDLPSDCGGKGSCGKCVVVAHPLGCLAPADSEERAMLSAEQLDRGERLACRARIQDSGVIYVLCADVPCVSAKTSLAGTYPADPAVRRVVVPSIDLSAGSIDLAAHVAALVRKAGGAEIRFKEPESLRQLGRAVRKGGPVTCVSHGERGVTAVLAGERNRSLGLAVDIGTTTLAVYLCDLRTGELLGSAGAANPQRLFGEDVISRICYADENEHGTGALQRLVSARLNELAAGLLAGTGLARDDVDEVVVAGNTTMESLFAGYHPHSLGVFPYLPVARAPGDFRASDLGLDLNPGTNVHLLPVISGFLGGDTIGAILAERPHLGDKVLLIIDIGTNGEIVLGNRDALWATSCATGPALEGAHISCGMRASRGAISRIDIDPDTMRVCYDLIGGADEPPRGICGSGIIDAMAAMRRAGLLLPTGRLAEGKPGILSDGGGIGRRFVIASAPQGGAGREIAVTLQDVRQIQLAKAALFAGVRILMRKAGLSRVDEVVLTGAFGARFDWANAVAIGMFPDLGDAVVRVADNAAGMGAILALLEGKRRSEALRLAGEVRFVELAEEPDFQAEYVSAMSFPGNG